MLKPVMESRHPGGKEGREADLKRFKDDPLSFGPSEGRKHPTRDAVEKAQAAQRGEKR